MSPLAIISNIGIEQIVQVYYWLFYNYVDGEKKRWAWHERNLVVIDLIKLPECYNYCHNVCINLEANDNDISFNYSSNHSWGSIVNRDDKNNSEYLGCLGRKQLCPS